LLLPLHSSTSNVSSLIPDRAGFSAVAAVPCVGNGVAAVLVLVSWRRLLVTELLLTELLLLLQVVVMSTRTVVVVLMVTMMILFCLLVREAVVAVVYYLDCRTSKLKVQKELVM
jgi:hypothetical protein